MPTVRPYCQNVVVERHISDDGEQQESGATRSRTSSQAREHDRQEEKCKAATLPKGRG